MEYDYVIGGLGPTGIVIGLHLMSTDKKVLFIEASDRIGGCWKTEYIEGKYFSEHSPKVLSKYGSVKFNKLLKHLRVNMEYYEIRHSKTSLIYLAIQYLTICDILKLVLYHIVYLLNCNNKCASVKDWCELNNITKDGKEFMNIISIVLSTTFDKLKMDALVGFSFKYYKYLYGLHQLSHPTSWLEKAYDVMKTNQRFDFVFNQKIERIEADEQRVNNVRTSHNQLYRAKEYIMCVPIRQLYRIMKNSDVSNWFHTIDQFHHFTQMSSYTGIGFQLHYTEPVRIPEDWCWSCTNDWNIIALEKKHDCFSKDSRVVQVISCVIVNLDKKSKFLRKTVNECESIDEIVNEGVRQIYVSGKIHNPPYRVTVSKNITKTTEFGWEAFDTSYSNSIGTIPPMGKLSNLYTIGPHNIGEVVIIETAIKSAIQFCKNKKIKLLI